MTQATEAEVSREQVAEVVEGALGILDEPAKWCKNRFAEDAQGRVVRSTSPDAVAFCLDGALERAWAEADFAATYDDVRTVLTAALDSLRAGS